jgi:gluconate 2-dehydrogenase gamma chain
LPISRREFIKIGAAAAIGAGVASAIEIPILETVISNKNSDVKSLQNQVASDSQAFLILNKNEQIELEAMVETIIPTDSNGPGAKEAGAIFFIDHQLAGEYGNNGRMYMRGPFVMPGQVGPITVNGITYSDGVPSEPYPGPAYQYNFLMREFWRNALLAVETYFEQRLW